MIEDSKYNMHPSHTTDFYTMQEKTFCQISTSDGNDFYLLSTIKDDGGDGISLVMCDGSDAWSGEVDGKDLVKTSRSLKMKSEEYLDQTCKALTGQHGAGLNFQYEVKKKGRATEFSWKKMVSGIKFQLGFITLRSEDDASAIIKELFDYCIKSFKSQNEQIRTLQANTERLSTERTNALKRLEKCTAAKEALETDLYSKFQAVLNSKKSKLRDVRQELEEVRNNVPSQSTSSGKSSGKRRLSSSPEPEAVNGSDAGDSNESDYHSDDPATPRPSKQMRRNAIVPSDEGSSLLFLGDDDEDNEKAAPLARRQRRQRESHKKQTPSKPVIPKVSSSKKPSLTRGSSGASSSSGSTGVRSSSRRSGSQANADDLMDLM